MRSPTDRQVSLAMAAGMAASSVMFLVRSYQLGKERKHVAAILETHGEFATRDLRKILDQAEKDHRAELDAITRRIDEYITGFIPPKDPGKDGTGNESPKTPQNRVRRVPAGRTLSSGPGQHKAASGSGGEGTDPRPGPEAKNGGDGGEGQSPPSGE